MSAVKPLPKPLTDQNPFPPDCEARFRPVRALAQGGFGAVWLAEQRDLSREVAVKLLLADVLEEQDQVARFANEAKITAALSHPRIIRLVDHGAEYGVPWIAYELAPGRSLRAVLDATPGGLPFERALEVALQVADALAAAHAAGVLHRDVKPENVLEGSRPGWDWKVVDFGIAKWTREGAVKTATGIVLGTPAYLAPELLMGTPASEASDVYALGVMAFEVFTGQRPYTQDNLGLLMEQHFSAPIPRASAVRAELPAALDTALARAMAKQPGERHAGVRELAAELEALRPRPEDEQRPGTQAQAAVRPVSRARTGPTRPLAMRASRATAALAAGAPGSRDGAGPRWRAAAALACGLVALAVTGGYARRGGTGVRVSPVASTEDASPVASATSAAPGGDAGAASPRTGAPLPASPSAAPDPEVDAAVEATRLPFHQTWQAAAGLAKGEPVAVTPFRKALQEAVAAYHRVPLAARDRVFNAEATSLLQSAAGWAEFGQLPPSAYRDLIDTLFAEPVGAERASAGYWPARASWRALPLLGRFEHTRFDRLEPGDRAHWLVTRHEFELGMLVALAWPQPVDGRLEVPGLGAIRDRNLLRRREGPEDRFDLARRHLKGFQLHAAQARWRAAGGARAIEWTAHDQLARIHLDLGQRVRMRADLDAIAVEGKAANVNWEAVLDDLESKAARPGEPERSPRPHAFPGPRDGVTGPALEEWNRLRRMLSSPDWDLAAPSLEGAASAARRLAELSPEGCGALAGWARDEISDGRTPCAAAFVTLMPPPHGRKWFDVYDRCAVALEESRHRGEATADRPGTAERLMIARLVELADPYCAALAREELAAFPAIPPAERPAVEAQLTKLRRLELATMAWWACDGEPGPLLRFVLDATRDELSGLPRWRELDARMPR